MDWTNYTDNPVDGVVKKDMLKHLKSIRKCIPIYKREFMISQINNKRVLDIGMAEHDLKHMDSPNWKHNYIRLVTSHIFLNNKRS